MNCFLNLFSSIIWPSGGFSSTHAGTNYFAEHKINFSQKKKVARDDQCDTLYTPCCKRWYYHFSFSYFFLMFSLKSRKLTLTKLIGILAYGIIYITNLDSIKRCIIILNMTNSFKLYISFIFNNYLNWFHKERFSSLIRLLLNTYISGCFDWNWTAFKDKRSCAHYLSMILNRLLVIFFSIIICRCLRHFIISTKAQLYFIGRTYWYRAIQIYVIKWCMLSEHISDNKNKLKLFCFVLSFLWLKPNHSNKLPRKNMKKR